MPDLLPRHRHAIALPFVGLTIVAFIGGLLNDVDVRGRVVDDLTDRGIKNARIQHGVRATTTNADGEYALENVPRTSNLQIDAPGYLRTRGPATMEEIRMQPLSVTIYVSEEGAPEEKRIPSPQTRQGVKILATGNESGQITVAPHPGKDAMVLICAEGYESKEIRVEGVLMQMTLSKGGTGCPPLATPTPAPGASPSPSPAATAAPTPTGSP